MKPGEPIQIKAIVLRVEGNRLDAQTPNGQLIQTDVSNVREPAENKAVSKAPENKSKSK